MTQLDVLPIFGHDAWTFLQDVEKGFKAGYTLSDSNEYFPRFLEGHLSVTLVKSEPILWDEEYVEEHVYEAEVVQEPSANAVLKEDVLQMMGEEHVGAALNPDNTIQPPKPQAVRGRPKR